MIIDPALLKYLPTRNGEFICPFCQNSLRYYECTCSACYEYYGIDIYKSIIRFEISLYRDRLLKDNEHYYARLFAITDTFEIYHNKIKIMEFCVSGMGIVNPDYLQKKIQTYRIFS